MWIFCFKSKPEWRVPHPETLQLPEDSCIIVGIGTGWGGIGDCGDHGDRGNHGDHGGCGDRGDRFLIVGIGTDWLVRPLMVMSAIAT